MAGGSPPSLWTDPPTFTADSSAMDTSPDPRFSFSFSSRVLNDVPLMPAYHKPKPLPPLDLTAIDSSISTSGGPQDRDTFQDVSTADSNTLTDQETFLSSVIVTPRASVDREAANTLLVLSFGRPYLLLGEVPPASTADAIANSFLLPAAAASASITVSNAASSDPSVFVIPCPNASAATSLGERLVSLSAIASRFQLASLVEASDSQRDKTPPPEAPRVPSVDDEDAPLKFAQSLVPGDIPRLPSPDDSNSFGPDDMEITVTSAAGPPVAALQGNISINLLAIYFLI